MTAYLRRGGERERYLYEDEGDAHLYRFFLEHAAELKKDLAWVLRLRYYLALHEWGEPPLKSREEVERDIACMASARIGEISEYRSAHRSDVSMVFYNQELWGITDEAELRKKMLEIVFPPDLYPARPESMADTKSETSSISI